MALVHLALGEPEVALEWLERAVEVRAMGLVLARLESRFAPLRSDPRFAEVMSRVSLPFRPPDRAAAIPWPRPRAAGAPPDA